jgi:hypothetical protein
VTAPGPDDRDHAVRAEEPAGHQHLMTMFNFRHPDFATIKLKR